MTRPSETDRRFVTIYQCPEHQDFVTVCVEDDESGGTRVLGSKCCPNQYRLRLKRWVLTDELRDELIEELHE